MLTYPKGVGTALTKPHALKNCLTVIGETPDVDRATRLSIYGNGYFWRLMEGVGSTFSSIQNIIGIDAHNDLMRQYLIKHPSTFKSIDDIGAHMPAFLKGHPLLKKFPFLIDLAAIEWAANQSFFVDDKPLLDSKNLKRIPPAAWPKAKIKLDESVQLLKSSWPVDEIWREDGKLKKQQLVRLKKRPHFFLVFRAQENKFVRIAAHHAGSIPASHLFVPRKNVGENPRQTSPNRQNHERNRLVANLVSRMG